MAESQELQHATEMVAFWLYRGNIASEKGNADLAERHYGHAQKWLDRMNELLGNGDTHGTGDEHSRSAGGR